MISKTHAGLRALILAVALDASQHAGAASGHKSEAPIPAATLALMTAKDTAPAAPILIRTFKKEAELEVWKQDKDGRYVLLKTFPICRWSGQLGPKTAQGDRQTPEGFYSVAPAQLNPNSAYHLSFDIGYPNAYDQAHGGTGSYLMVHGTCSSAGCFAMTDKGVSEIYALVREAFAGGQPAFQFQAYPFRMTAANMARYRLDPNIGFWRQMKEGSDRFEATGEEPVIGVSAGRYMFEPAKDPEKEALAKARRAEEESRIAALIAKKTPAVRTAYADGGQHPSFRALTRRASAALGQVSRPEALALAGKDIVLGPDGLPLPTPAKTAKTACKPAAGPCPERSAEAKPAQAKSATVKRASQTQPPASPAKGPDPAAERPFYERFLDTFRSDPPREPGGGRRI